MEVISIPLLPMGQIGPVPALDTRTVEIVDISSKPSVRKKSTLIQKSAWLLQNYSVYLYCNETEKEMKNTVKSRKRQAQIEAGVYDGRFKTRIVPDKKKKESRELCRNFKLFLD